MVATYDEKLNEAMTVQDQVLTQLGIPDHENTSSYAWHVDDALLLFNGAHVTLTSFPLNSEDRRWYAAPAEIQRLDLAARELFDSLDRHGVFASTPALAVCKAWLLSQEPDPSWNGDGIHASLSSIGTLWLKEGDRTIRFSHHQTKRLVTQLAQWADGTALFLTGPGHHTVAISAEYAPSFVDWLTHETSNA